MTICKHEELIKIIYYKKEKDDWNKYLCSKDKRRKRIIHYAYFGHYKCKECGREFRIPIKKKEYEEIHTYKKRGVKYEQRLLRLL